MRTKFGFLVFFIFASALLPVMPLTTAQEEILQNDVFEIRQVRLGGQTTGVHLFSARVSNRTEVTRTFGVDIRTEAFGLGRPNWQKQFFFRLNGHESRRVEAEYEVASPLLSRILLRMGEAPEYDNWARLPEEERSKTRRPDIKIYWRKEFPAKTPISPEELRDSAFRYSVYLEPEHNSRAREIYRQVFPYFEDLDPLNVTPLIAHVPLLIVSGAQDSQFKPSGVVEVDEATQAAYRKFDLSVCSELYLEPRADHWVDPTASSLIAAFYERWLR